MTSAFPGILGIEPPVAIKSVLRGLRARKGGSLGELQHVLRCAVAEVASVPLIAPFFFIVTPSFPLGVLVGTVVKVAGELH